MEALVCCVAVGLACGGPGGLTACSGPEYLPGASAVGGAGGGAGTSGVRPPDSLLPARVRRLANAEYDASVQALLSTRKSPASEPDFPPDLRRDGFTVNAAQRVDAVIVERLADAADALATEAQANGTLARLAPCAPPADATSCARSFITTFGAKVYRRPLVDEEVQALLSLYAVGADGASYEDGIAHVTRGLLQSAGFLYVTELGDGKARADATVALTPYEIAASLAYLVTSAPPDDELAAKAASGAPGRSGRARGPGPAPVHDRRRARGTPPCVWCASGSASIASTRARRIRSSTRRGKPKRRPSSPRAGTSCAPSPSSRRATVSELLGARWTVSSGPLALYRTAGSGPTLALGIDACSRIASAS